MKCLKYIAVLLLVVVLLFVGSSTVSAQACFTDPDSGNWAYCEPNPLYPGQGDPLNCVETGGGGSQEAHDCCLAAGTSTCEEAGGGDTGGNRECHGPQNISCSTVEQVNWGSCTTWGDRTQTICSLGNAQYYDNCAGSEETPCRSARIVTCGCCPAGSVSNYYWSTPSNYTVSVNPCEYESTTNCYPNVFVSYVEDGYQCGTTRKDEEGQKHLIYTGHKTCQTRSDKVYYCEVICSATAPSTPTLLTPANGSTVTTTNLSLAWNNTSQTWGTACSAQNNQFSIWVGTSPTSLALVGTVGSGTGSIAFSGNEGQTYYWQVRAQNGQLTTNSDVWSFTIGGGDPWWQVKDGDVTTTGDLSSDVPSSYVFGDVG